MDHVNDKRFIWYIKQRDEDGGGTETTVSRQMDFVRRRTDGDTLRNGKKF